MYAGVVGVSMVIEMVVLCWVAIVAMLDGAVVPSVCAYILSDESRLHITSYGSLFDLTTGVGCFVTIGKKSLFWSFSENQDLIIESVGAPLRGSLVLMYSLVLMPRFFECVT